jgi:transposase-like protein
LAAGEEDARWGVEASTEEFRRNAAKLALDGGRSIRDAARELGINHKTLRNWVYQLRRERRDGRLRRSPSDARGDTPLPGNLRGSRRYEQMAGRRLRVRE